MRENKCPRALFLVLCLKISLSLGATLPKRSDVSLDPDYDPRAAVDPGDAGASGDAGGSVNLSRGATIAIAVVVSIVAALGGESKRQATFFSIDWNLANFKVISAVLFYLAKKQQWEVRKSIRKSTRRLTGSFKPPNSAVPRSDPRKRDDKTAEIRDQSPHEKHERFK